MNPTDQDDVKLRNFKKMFSMSNIVGKIISYGAYIVVLASILVLCYLSFVENFKFELNWSTIGIFSFATIALSWFVWNTFYHKQYEDIMSRDVAQQEVKKYSIHQRYYLAIKDWDDASLQAAIDKFNDEYTEKWLRWVERITGKPIKTHKEKLVDPDTGEERIVEVVGIEDLPYKGFKYKKIMWRIKHHKYPQSGYKTSMELMSLFSYQEANLNKRNLRADKQFYTRKAVTRIIMKILVVVTGASLIPELITGQYWAAVLKLILAIGTIMSSVFTGMLSGVQGARLKLSLVENACDDLEHWANKKPIVLPYTEPGQEEQEEPEVPETRQPITHKIFDELNNSKK